MFSSLRLPETSPNSEQFQQPHCPDHSQTRFSPFNLRPNTNLALHGQGHGLTFNYPERSQHVHRTRSTSNR